MKHSMNDDELKMVNGGTGSAVRKITYSTVCRNCGQIDYFTLPQGEPKKAHICSKCGNLIDPDFVEEVSAANMQ